MKTGYYNTNNESGSVLAKSQSKGEAKAKIIKDYYESNMNKMFAPHQVWTACFDTEKVPLTSVRRAISDLTDEGELEMMPDEYMVPGLYDKNVHVWRFNRKKGQLTMF